MIEPETMPDKRLSDKIEILIDQTPDPAQQAMLRILLKIADSLAENTSLTKQLHDRLEAHEKEEMDLIAQIRGGGKVARFMGYALAAVFAAMQGISLYVFDDHMAAFAAVEARIGKVEQFQARHEEHHKWEEWAKRETDK
jgi:hypothetical protein